MSTHRTITVAVAEPPGEVRTLGKFPNSPESVRKTLGKWGPLKDIRACYEAGPTGRVLYGQLTALGVDSQVMAPSLIPAKPRRTIASRLIAVTRRNWRVVIDREG